MSDRNITIYVDDLASWGRTVGYHGDQAAHAERVGARHDHNWCHLFADEPDCPELHQFAKKLGLKRKWFQGNHYDLVPTKRQRAVAFGAKEASREESVAVWRKWRERPDRIETSSTEQTTVHAAMTLFDHPIWPHIAIYGHMTEGRENLDFLQMPDQLRALALEVVANCVSCGQLINPLRARQKSERSRIAGTALERRLFYAPTCPTEKNAGCSRTKEAKLHKDLVRRVFAAREVTQ